MGHLEGEAAFKANSLVGGDKQTCQITADFFIESFMAAADQVEAFGFFAHHAIQLQCAKLRQIQVE